MTHAELVARAARWLAGPMGCGVVLHEFVTAVAAGQIPDAIGWTRSMNAIGGYGQNLCFGQSAWSIQVECKASRADFFSDADKLHRQHEDRFGIGQERWYFTPAGLVIPSEVPEAWGLAYACAKGVRRVKEPVRVRFDPDVAAREAPMLLSAVRRLSAGLGHEVVLRRLLVAEEEP